MLFTTIFIFIIDLIIKTTNPGPIEDTHDRLININSFVLPSVAMFLYVVGHIDIIIFKKRQCKTPFLAKLLPVIAGILFLANFMFNHINSIYFSLTSNIPQAWTATLTLASESLYILLIFMMVTPEWYIRILLPFCYYIAINAAYLKADHPDIAWNLVRNFISLFFCIGVLVIHEVIRKRQAAKNSNTEEWNQVYMDILDKNPSCIAVVNTTGKFIYSNTSFKQLTRSNPEEAIYTAITNLRTRNLYGPIINPHKSIFNSPLLSPSSQLPFCSEESFVKPSMIVRKKLSTKDTRRMTVFSFTDLGALLDHYRTLLEEGRLDKEEQLVFDGKYTAPALKNLTCSTPKTKELSPGKDKASRKLSLRMLGPTLSYEVILKPLPENKKIIIILNDTTNRDLIANLESNSEYKDKLLATMSHELRTPLNGNLGFLQAGIDDKTIPSWIRSQYLVPAWRAGRILTHVIDDILDYSQSQTEDIKLKLEQKSIKQTINYCCELYEQAFQARGIKLLQEVSEEIPSLFSTDHSRLVQILLNLLSNAHKFTERGSVTIKAKLLSNLRVEVTVQDTGLGMKQDNVAQLFEEKLFYDEPGGKEVKSKGTGLGLRIAGILAQALADDYDQDAITVKSELNIGSSFIFILKHITEEESHEVDVSMSSFIEEDKQPKSPITASSLEAHPITSQGDVPYEHIHGSVTAFGKLSTEHFRIRMALKDMSQESSSSERKLIVSHRREPKVLIVDDDAVNLLVLDSFLKQFGLPTESAINGKEALNKIMGNPEGFGLVLMDCQMPVMDGFEATKALIRKMNKNQLPAIPIIGCTAFNGQDKLSECLRCGMKEVLSKPVMKEKLGEIIKKYMKKEIMNGSACSTRRNTHREITERK